MVSGWTYPPITDQPGSMFLQMQNCDCLNRSDAFFTDSFLSDLSPIIALLCHYLTNEPIDLTLAAEDANSNLLSLLMLLKLKRALTKGDSLQLQISSS